MDEQSLKAVHVNGLFAEQTGESTGCVIMEDSSRKGKGLITLPQHSRFPPPIQSLCCSKSNL